MGNKQAISNLDTAKTGIDIETIVNNQNTIIGLLDKLLRTEQEVIIIEEIPRDEAKRRIEDYFAGNDGDIFYDELIDELHIGLELVVELCEELKNEGKIEVA